jgi:5-formyltetrahydrofolate cyclo-ligase
LTPKYDLRRAARERRKELMLASPDFAQVLARYAETLAVQPGMIVGGYHAMPEEADPALLLERLVEMGAQAAFPRVAARGQPLDYHRVPDGEVLAPGTFGIREPLPSWPSVTPHILLVPLLAFDARGHRLGYGGGFYDRTLEALNVPAIGIGFAGQEVSSLPAEAHDIALSAVLTEAGFRRFS